MSLLFQIAGQRGENLCSTMLGHIMLRSPEARDALVEFFSKHSPRGPISLQNQFAVFREETTYNEDEETHGRVDLVVETDDSIIGIENKFYADFQDRQPAGYIEHLKQRAKALKELRGREFEYVLFVLAPDRRRQDVRERIVRAQASEQCEFVSWEELLQCLQSLPRVSVVDRFLIDELALYAQDQIMPTADLARLLPHLKRNWRIRGTAIQRQFLSHYIWALLEPSLTERYHRAGVGIDYYGYYFYDAQDNQRQVWLGFVDRAVIAGNDDRAEAAALMAAVLSQDKSLKPPVTGHFHRIEIPSWEQSGWEASELVFSPSDAIWLEPRTWKEALEPVNNIFQQAK